MQKGEPPSCARSSMFMIGKNSRGNWVVQDQRGTCGGLFVDRIKALRFALFENGNNPQAVVMVPGVLELNTSGHPLASRSFPVNHGARRKLQMA
jgi:hypothetical protein